MKTQALLLVLVLLAVGASSKKLQLNAKGESVLLFWPGDFSQTHQETCAIAITNKTIWRIKDWKVYGSQPLPVGTTAAALIYNYASTALWLGFSVQDTITWWSTSYSCQEPFDPGFQHPSFSFPGTIWDRGLTVRPEDNQLQNLATFIGDNLLVRFGFDQGTGWPFIAEKYSLPVSFPGASRTVVGFGKGLPFSGTTTPSLVVAREIVTNAGSTGELILIDPTKSHSHPVLRYMPNIAGWQSHYTSKSVAAIALINPFGQVQTGTCLGFIPGIDQPLSISIPWTATQRWSSAVAWTQISATSSVGMFLVGQAQPGGPLTLRYVYMGNNGTFYLLDKRETFNETDPLWIPETFAFISAPSHAGSDDNEIFFTAQNSKGPVLFDVLINPIPADELKKVAKDSPQAPILSLQEKRSVLCDSASPCQLLSPTNICHSDCCQTYLPPQSSQFKSVCCKDCNLGNCVGDPGKCVH